MRLIHTISRRKEDYGLYHEYGEELFCLLSRTCVTMFAWEYKAGKKLYSLDNIGLYKELLEMVDVKLDPKQFYVEMHKTTGFPAIYESKEVLLYIARMRIAEWQKSQKYVNLSLRSELNKFLEVLRCKNFTT